MENQENIEQIVEKVENGEYGGPFEIEDNLGKELFNKVQEKILEKFKNKTIEDIFSEVMANDYGIREERKLKLGYMWEIIQNRINEEMDLPKRYALNDKQIEIMAKRTLEGEFGTGMNRKRKLGNEFKKIQNKVNEIIGDGRRYDLNLLSIDEYIDKLYNHEMTDEQLKREIGEPTYCYIRNKVNEINKIDERCKITKACIDELAEWTIKLEFGEDDERKRKLGELS